MTYEERMAKAEREQQRIDARMRQAALEQQRATEMRLLAIARATRLLSVQDEVLVPALAQLVKTLQGAPHHA